MHNCDADFIVDFFIPHITMIIFHVKLVKHSAFFYNCIATK